MISFLYWPTLLLLLLKPNDSSCMLDNTSSADGVFDRLFNDLIAGYNYRIRPYFGEKPVEVEVFVYVGSLRSLSEITMDYKLELYFREYWQDPRLAYDPLKYGNLTKIPLHESLSASLWVPDTFLPNAIHSENPDISSITHRSLLRLDSSGRVLLSRRLSVTAECPMDLSSYPFDQQVCRLSVESYGYSTDDIIYSWRKINPVTFSDQLTLPDFRLHSVITKNRNITLATGTYSRLECCFVFVRSAGFYFVQLFIPATAIVITAWLSLWMEKESSFSDMIEVILAITFLYYSYNTVMPKVSYIKAMDIFLGFCFIFVFAALIKLAIMKNLRERATACELLGQRVVVHQSSQVELKRPVVVRSLPYSRKKSISRLVNYAATTSINDHQSNGRKISDFSLTDDTVSNSCCVGGVADVVNGEMLPPTILINPNEQLDKHWRRLNVCKTFCLVTYPLAFVIFCTYYFIVYVLNAKQTSMDNCTFE